MRKIFILASFVFISFGIKAQSLYDQSLNDISGNTVDLKKFFGQKIIFIILPLTTSDSSKITEINSLQVVAGNKAKIIGLLSKEDGYTGDTAAIKTIYGNMNIVLSEGLYTKRSSGNQAGLLQWLTDIRENFKSDAEAARPGQAFIISETGSLMLMIRPNASLESPGLSYVLNKVTGH